MLITGAEIGGRRADCRLRGDRIVEIGRLTRGAGEPALDAAGGALLPGLADHHLHLRAIAAAATSVELTGLELPEVLARLTEAAAGETAAPAGRRIRAVGWSGSDPQALDREALDRCSATTPIRVSHRSGALWVLNSSALDQLGESAAHPGVECDAAGRPTGRLWRADELLRTADPGGESVAPRPGLSAVGRRLAAYGITQVTDATPGLDDADVAAFVEASRSGALPQQLMLLGAPCIAGLHPARFGPRVRPGPVKIVVADHALPDPETLAARIDAAHRAGRAAAVHCVTRVALVLTLAAIRIAGGRTGDRVEHAGVAGPAEAAALAELGVRVVTQPAMLAARGDDYLTQVDAADRADLWPYRSLLAAGVRVACSSDAPYGDLDPWAGVRAAVDRRTPLGTVVGSAERVSADTALASLLTDVADPGGAARTVRPGAVADLVLLRAPRAEVLAAPAAELVRATFCAGVRVA